MTKVKRRAKAALWSIGTIVRYGVPKLLISLKGGIGDHLLCTAVFRELRKRKFDNLWMMSNHAELFSNNSDVDLVVPEDRRYIRLAQAFNREEFDACYTPYLIEQDQDVPPEKPIIALLCQKVGMTGKVLLRPYMTLDEREQAAMKPLPRQIAIQSSGLSARYPMANKEWDPTRFQTVIDTLKSEFNFVQIGSRSDFPLNDVRDLRGKTSIRETAAVLKNSILFIGLVWAPMHIARAVDCRSVIVYGGR